MTGGRISSAACPMMPFKARFSSDEKTGTGEKRLRMAGCFLKREGSNHSLRTNPKNGVTEAIPHHAEIKEPLARKILKHMDAE